MINLNAQERLGLGVAALLLATGAAVRALAPQGALPELAGTAVEDSVGNGLRGRVAAEIEDESRRREPLRAGERLDPNTATAAELDRLPQVGPALAARILEWRAAHGRFRSLADLDSVPGIGPSTLARLAPLVTLAPVSPGAAPAPSAAGSVPAAAAAVDVNRASAAELEALPGIGPALAGRVVAEREAHGPFRSPRELERVPGIGPKLRARLEPHVRADP